MGTTAEDIGRWFDEGVEEGATHMIVVCDTYDYEDYPVFVKKGQDVRKVYQGYLNGLFSIKRQEKPIRSA